MTVATAASHEYDVLATVPHLPAAQGREVIERLVRDPRPAVRGPALRVGASVLPQKCLVHYLRDGADDQLRNAGREMVKLRGSDGEALAVELLSDSDPDVVLAALEILEHKEHNKTRALEPLRRLLRHTNVNVVQSAVVALGRLGDASVVEDVVPLLDNDLWVRAAVIKALGDLRAKQAVPTLARLLDDAMAGPIAAEALALIGGADARRRLARHWLASQPSGGYTLEQLARALETAPRPAVAEDGLRAALTRELDSSGPSRLAAARCVLALGPGPEDEDALGILVGATPRGASLPACLDRRGDLIGQLLTGDDPARTWGLMLACRYPAATPMDAVARVICADDEARLDVPLLEVLRSVRGLPIADALVTLYVSLPDAARASLSPGLRAQGRWVREALRRRRRRTDLDHATRTVLETVVAGSAVAVARALKRLDIETRLSALTHLTDRASVIRRLPWTRWLTEAPDRYATHATRAAASGGLPDIKSTVRRLLTRAPSLPLVALAAELKDRRSVPCLVDVLAQGDPALAPMVLNALGKIGGPRARETLRRIAEQEEPTVARIAVRALSHCAKADDRTVFLDALRHSDWLMRLAALEALSRLLPTDELGVLIPLMGDPVPIVADRARELLLN